jgi:hypothetical protein
MIVLSGIPRRFDAHTGAYLLVRECTDCLGPVRLLRSDRGNVCTDRAAPAMDDSDWRGILFLLNGSDPKEQTNYNIFCTMPKIRTPEGQRRKV